MKRLIKEIRHFGFMLLYGYIANHIIANIPCSILRLFFYRFVMRKDIDSSVQIHMGLYLYPTRKSNLHIGKNTIINSSCIIDDRDDIFIGENVNISSNCALYTAGHIINSPSFAYYGSRVIISDYVWLGTRSMIMPGVKVGYGAVVLPGAIVTHDVPNYAIVGGVPAKFIAWREKDLTYQLSYREFFL